MIDTGFTTDDPVRVLEHMGAIQGGLNQLDVALKQHLSECMAECEIGIQECNRCLIVKQQQSLDYVSGKLQQLDSHLYASLYGGLGEVGEHTSLLEKHAKQTGVAPTQPQGSRLLSGDAGGWCVWRMPGDSCAIAPFGQSPPGGGTLVACYPDEASATAAAAAGCGTQYVQPPFIPPGPIPPPPPENIPPLPPPYVQPPPDISPFPTFPPPPPPLPPPPKPKPVTFPTPVKLRLFCVYCVRGRPRVIRETYSPPTKDWMFIGCSADPVILQQMTARCHYSPNMLAGVQLQPRLNISSLQLPSNNPPLIFSPFQLFQTQLSPTITVSPLPPILPSLKPPPPSPVPPPPVPPSQPPLPSEPLPPESPPQDCIPTFSEDEYIQALNAWLEAEAESGGTGIYGAPCPPELPPVPDSNPPTCPEPEPCPAATCAATQFCSPPDLNLDSIAALGAGLLGGLGTSPAGQWLGLFARELQRYGTLAELIESNRV